MTNKTILRQFTDRLLSEYTSWNEKRETLLSMGRFFAQHTAVDTHHHLTQQKGKEQWLENGCAISSWGAAMCLFEISRTKIFISGIIAAIRNLLQTIPQRPVHILDAGCGPYALLSVLPALYFSPQEIQLHFIDIIPENIEAAGTLVAALGMNEYCSDMQVTDATQFTWAHPYPLHMVISETMLNALRKEPQVAITLNLAKQLAPNGILIPEDIEVTLMQVDNRTKQQALLQYTENNDDSIVDYEHCIAQVMQVNKQTSFTGSKEFSLCSVALPSTYHQDIHQLELHTAIRVFGNFILHKSDCSLTLPLVIGSPFKHTIPSNSTLHFTYRLTGHPGIQYSISENAY